MADVYLSIMVSQLQIWRNVYKLNNIELNMGLSVTV